MAARDPRGGDKREESFRHGPYVPPMSNCRHDDGLTIIACFGGYDKGGCVLLAVVAAGCSPQSGPEVYEPPSQEIRDFEDPTPR